MMKLKRSQTDAAAAKGVSGGAMTTSTSVVKRLPLAKVAVFLLPQQVAFWMAAS
ncbi:hypothetical protein DPMN_174607 [Dreissena polymorpha]|uniref:Uncharacterized protein n=1 Tax=Dreissena polymorpha TaxID=45954 RepID=A0A9D4E6N6_DREPO|nr:hypothetical protein DPMN_174607 [Dreissena polymorpha]